MKRIKWFIGCVLLSTFAVISLLARPVEASANFTIANCFRSPASDGPVSSTPAWTQSIFNQHIRSVVGNNNITVDVSYGRTGSPGNWDTDWITINSVTVNDQTVQAQSLAITHNSHGGTNCVGFTFFAESQTTMVYKLFNADGTESGYGLRRDCGNLVRYPVTPQAWESTGETQIFSTGAFAWVKDYPEASPMIVRRGDQVQWRHRVNIKGITGNPTFNIQATTVQTDNVGNSARFNSHPVTVQGSGTTRATNWYQRSWTIPETANDSDLFCQYWEWTPANGADQNSSGNSAGDLRQCVVVEVGLEDSCPPLTGTTTLNGGSIDITVEPGTSVTWTHTLSQTATTPPSAFTGTITFQPQWTDGGTGTIQGGNATLPLTANQVRTSNIVVEEGDRVC